MRKLLIVFTIMAGHTLVNAGSSVTYRNPTGARPPPPPSSSSRIDLPIIAGNSQSYAPTSTRSQVSSATTLSSHSPSSYSRTDEKSFSRNDVFRLYQTAPKRESSYNFRMSREQFAESINTRNRSRQMDARPDKWKYQPRAMRDLPAVPQIRPSGLPKIKAPSGNEYIIRTYIAHGTFSHVYLLQEYRGPKDDDLPILDPLRRFFVLRVIDTLNAISVFKKDSGLTPIEVVLQLTREIEYLVYLNDWVGSARIRDSWLNGHRIFEVTAYVSGGDLYNQMVALNWFYGHLNGLDKIKKLVAVLALIINTLHVHMNVQHADIKLENFLVSMDTDDFGLVKVADFGLACDQDEAVRRDFARDWEGLSVIVMQLLTGFYGITKEKPLQYLNKIEQDFIGTLALMDCKAERTMENTLKPAAFMAGVNWVEASSLIVPFTPVLFKDLTKLAENTYILPRDQFPPLEPNSDGTPRLPPTVFTKYAHAFQYPDLPPPKTTEKKSKSSEYVVAASSPTPMSARPSTRPAQVQPSMRPVQVQPSMRPVQPTGVRVR